MSFMAADHPVAAVVEDRVLLCSAHQTGAVLRPFGELCERNALQQHVETGEVHPGSPPPPPPPPPPPDDVAHAPSPETMRSVGCMASARRLGCGVRAATSSSDPEPVNTPCCSPFGATREVEFLAVAPGNAGTGTVADQHDVAVAFRARGGRPGAAPRGRPGGGGPRGPLVLGVADAVRAAGIACFGPSRTPPASRAPRRSPRRSWPPPGCATAGQRGRRQSGPPRRGTGPLRPVGRRPPGWSRTTSWPPARAWWSPTTATRPRARRRTARTPGIGALESFLDGPEVSLFCVADGETVGPAVAGPGLQTRRRQRQRAPTPAAWAPTPRCPRPPPRRSTRSSTRLLKPVAAEMVSRGSSFSGLLYAGLAITSAGPAWWSSTADSATRDPGGAGAAGIAARATAERGGHRTLASHDALQWRDGA